ncbi:MAG: cytochrome c oxidase subunit II [Planctomycetes bacterium]|nr:cytochrome c oxidase subunit II [Planctomycetota bacterium]
MNPLSGIFALAVQTYPGSGTAPLFPPSASTISGEVDALYWFLIGVSVFFSALICALVIGFSVRFRRRPGVHATPIEGSLPLELLWTIVPLGIAMVIFIWGAKVYFRTVKVPSNAMQIEVTGKQWMWKVQHPTGQREINDLHVPVGVPIKLRMISEDVIHSYFIPAFRIKRDVVPGRYSTAWFEATEPGEYHLFCAEYCGTKHSQMIGRVYALDPVDYQRWLSGTVAGETPKQAGEKLFASLRCDTCHNTQSGARGPDLAGLWGSEVALRSGGTVRFDADYVRESILNPAAKIVKGYEPLMPSYSGQVSEEQLLALIAHLESLSAPQGAKDRP